MKIFVFPLEKYTFCDIKRRPFSMFVSLMRFGAVGALVENVNLSLGI